MPARVTRALVLLERALALDPAYALAHAYAAMCHHCLFLRAGLREEEPGGLDPSCAGRDHAWPGRRARTDIRRIFHRHGRTRPCCRVRRIRGGARLSPSSALTYILGSVIYGWTGEAERAIEWGERGLRLSPFDPWAFAAFHALTLGHFHRGRYEEAANAAHKARPIQSGPQHLLHAVWRRRSPSSGGSKKRRLPRPGFGIAARLPVQPPICRCGLRTGARRVVERGAPRCRAAGVELQSSCLLSCRFAPARARR